MSFEGPRHVLPLAGDVDEIGSRLPKRKGIGQRANLLRPNAPAGGLALAARHIALRSRGSKRAIVGARRAPACVRSRTTPTDSNHPVRAAWMSVDACGLRGSLAGIRAHAV